MPALLLLDFKIAVLEKDPLQQAAPGAIFFNKGWIFFIAEFLSGLASIFDKE